MKSRKFNKSELAVKLGLARSTLYYQSRKKERDETDKQLILAVMGSNPSYGHKRIALEIAMNKKKVLRLMKKFDLKPKIARKGGWVKAGDIGLPEAVYANELKNICPIRPDIAWAGDFTYIKYRGSFLYLATILDIYTREIIGSAVSKWHSRFLVKSALLDAMKQRRQLPQYFHSDQGSEYRSEEHADYLTKLGVTVSMSRKSSPWQNGFQESFYSQFKLELGPVNRFLTDGHLAEAIYKQIYYYNNRRRHTALHMAPTQFYQLAVKGRSN